MSKQKAKAIEQMQAAAGKLLAAEAEYLRACGWIAWATAGMGSEVVWSSPDNTKRENHAAAVAFQKMLDGLKG